MVLAVGVGSGDDAIFFLSKLDPRQGLGASKD